MKTANFLRNKNCLFWVIALFLILFSLSANFPFASALGNSENKICVVYITGIGCPNCAITDPELLVNYTARYSNLIIVEYEIYNLRASNQDIANQYFESYIPTVRPGVPFIIFDKNKTGIGRFQVIDSKTIIEELNSNDCPLPDGSSVSFDELDITNLSGKIKIWAKDRVLISGRGGNNKLLKNLLLTDDISSFLENVNFKKVEPQPVLISGGRVEFSHAVEIDNWILEWNEKPSAIGTEEEKNDVAGGINEVTKTPWQTWYWILIISAFLIFSLTFYKFKIFKKCACICLTEEQKNYLIIGISLLFLVGFFVLAKNISPDALEKLGYSLPLPLFTAFIALIDGFNPCNLFVLTLLLGLLVSASHSRIRIYIIGYTFIFVVFVIYFLFMAAWLNIFKYMGFVTPLRIGIAIIALIAGIINCKELVAFRKGITLMVQERHKGPLLKRIEKMKEIIVNSSMPTLIFASVSLAAFASLVELPCTAGFPIIYTGVLTGKMLINSFSYYLYLLFYNFIYVIPLMVIITIFGYTFKGKQVTQRQMAIIKFIGGLIMILLGIILLFNPALIGLGM